MSITLHVGNISTNSIPRRQWHHQFAIKIPHAARPRRRGNRMSGKILSEDSAPHGSIPCWARIPSRRQRPSIHQQVGRASIPACRTLTISAGSLPQCWVVRPMPCSIVTKRNDGRSRHTCSGLRVCYLKPRSAAPCAGAVRYISSTSVTPKSSPAFEKSERSGGMRSRKHLHCHEAVA